MLDLDTDYTVFTDKGACTWWAKSPEDAVAAIRRIPGVTEIYGAVRQDMAVYVKSPKPEPPKLSEFTVTFRATVGAGNTLTAGGIRDYVEREMSYWPEHACSWSDVTVTPVEETAPEPPALNSEPVKAVPLPPWETVLLGAASLRDTGTWTWPAVPAPATSLDDDDYLDAVMAEAETEGCGE